MIDFLTWIIGGSLFFVIFNIAGITYLKLFVESPKNYD